MEVFVGGLARSLTEDKVRKVSHLIRCLNDFLSIKITSCCVLLTIPVNDCTGSIMHIRLAVKSVNPIFSYFGDQFTFI